VCVCGWSLGCMGGKISGHFPAKSNACTCPPNDGPDVVYTIPDRVSGGLVAGRGGRSGSGVMSGCRGTAFPRATFTPRNLAHIGLQHKLAPL